MNPGSRKVRHTASQHLKRKVYRDCPHPSLSKFTAIEAWSCSRYQRFGRQMCRKPIVPIPQQCAFPIVVEVTLGNGFIAQLSSIGAVVHVSTWCLATQVKVGLLRVAHGGNQAVQLPGVRVQRLVRRHHDSAETFTRRHSNFDEQMLLSMSECARRAEDPGRPVAWRRS